jgi:hypothetical protein
VSYLSQALEWMRAVLFGPCTPGRHSRQAAPQVPREPRYRPTPYVVGARLVDVPRLRRQRQATAEEAWERTGGLVRPYVLAHEAEQRTARTGEAPPWAGPWASPWETAQ